MGCETPRWLVLTVFLGLGCGGDSADAASSEAPDPIGAELLRVEGTWALPACARSHLYRQGREVQYQCFDVDGRFSWENRGLLTSEAALMLDAAIAAADLDDTAPVNYMGLCAASDTQGTLTLWVDDQGISFAPFCLFEGIVGVYEQVSGIETELSECREPLQELESLEPGCRAAL